MLGTLASTQDNSEGPSQFQSLPGGSAEAFDDIEWQLYFALCPILLPSLPPQILILRALSNQLSAC